MSPSTARRTCPVAAVVLALAASILAAPELAFADANPARQIEAWRRLPDLDARLATLASLQTGLAAPTRATARARLAAFPADLAGHRALAAADPVHGAAVEDLVTRIAASGDGSEARPWRVPGAGDAVAFLRERGETPVGGYYATTGAYHLELVVEARPPGATWARARHFDLGATLAAWRDATGATGGAVRRRDARALVEAWAEAGDHFARTATGLLRATELGRGGHYRAARLLEQAAEAGNGVARYSLGDLFLQLAEGRPDLAATALESGRAHHRRAAALGLGHAHYKRGLLALREGDRSAAREHLEAARAAGEADALAPLLALLREADPQAAITMLADAARAGDGDAAYDLAVLRLEEDGIRDPQAIALLTAAAAAGHTDARLFLGDLLATGRFVDRDRARARKLWADVARESDDAGAVLAGARALTENRTASLHDPESAAAGLERILAAPRVAASCADCWRVLAAALEARGEAAAARAALESGRRALAGRSRRTGAPGS